MVPGPADSLVFAILFQLEQSQWWRAERLAAHQYHQLEALVAHAVATTPFYRERLGGLSGLVGRLAPEAFHGIPLLTRADLQSNAAALSSASPPKDHGTPSEVHSSGSTGRPVTVKLSEVSALFNRALNMRFHYWHERDFRGKVAAIVALRTEALAELAERGVPTSWASVFRSGPMLYCDILRPISEQLAWLDEAEPDYLLTYPTNLRALLDASARGGFRPKRLREAAVMGEVVDPDIAERCREEWNVPVVASYSAMEVGLIAMQCGQRGAYHIQSESVFVEVIDDDGAPCAPGEVGHVVVTDLHNFVMPLIRYQVGDFAEVGTPCACGRGLPTLARIIGRSRNMFLLPSGEKFWPIAFRVGELDEIATIRQIQLVQRTTTQIDVKLVTDAPLDAEAAAKLRRYLATVIRHPFEFNLVYVDDIPRAPNGKYEDYRSEVA
jgi:phenylacetate-coenzyme A ligase PaaK-like adenylate-forming protein